MSNPLMEKMLDIPEFEVTDFKQNDNDMGFMVLPCRLCAKKELQKLILSQKRGKFYF